MGLRSYEGGLLGLKEPLETWRFQRRPRAILPEATTGNGLPSLYVFSRFSIRSKAASRRKSEKDASLSAAVVGVWNQAARMRSNTSSSA